VDEPGHEPLKQLPLAQDDHGLVLDPLGNVPEAVDRLAELDEVDEQLGPPAEQGAGDGERRGKRDSADGDVYERALPRPAARVAFQRPAARIAFPRPAARVAFLRPAARVAFPRPAARIAFPRPALTSAPSSALR
jgi:hypothetical protein